MKEVFSFFAFGITAVCFVAFFAVLKPNSISVARGPMGPEYCSAEPSPRPVCRPRVFAAGPWAVATQRW